MIGPWMTLMAMKMKIEKELQMLFTTLEFTVFVHQNVTANVLRSIVEEYSRMDYIGAVIWQSINFLLQAYYIKHSQIIL